MPDLIYEKFPDKHYAVFTMNRPERLNALGGTMQAELQDALHDFSQDVGMTAGIVTGNGRAFCAGADLKEMTERNAAAAEIKAKLESGEIKDYQSAMHSNVKHLNEEGLEVLNGEDSVNWEEMLLEESYN